MIWAAAQGKVNLHFQVGDLQPDGYHPVVSLYQALDLEERVGVEKSSSWSIKVVSELPNLSEIPLDESNLVVKAAKALAQSVGIENPQPMHFEIHKQVPVAGGMAGGSADAAAALVALNEAWCLGLDQAGLMKVGASIGADVPFAILGGTALGSDTGIELAPHAKVISQPIVLLINHKPLSTKAVFGEFDRLKRGERLRVPNFSVGQDWLGKNSLTEAAFSLLPELRDLAAQDFGCGTGILSGSGPTLWYLAKDQVAAKNCAENIRLAGFESVIAKPSELGSRLI
ncbi:MAG: 4-(cytidine 5-diphospho)-2-C-methyl-D-erythritol kinase [Actinomycetota bacterium]